LLKNRIGGILLLTVVLSLSMLSQSYALPSRIQPKAQAQPNSFYYNPPAPLNGSYTSSGFDLDPAALVTLDGNLWIAWESNRAGTYQIYYQVYNGITWTTPTIVSTAAFNSAPSLAQLNNGTVVLVWAGGTNGNDNHLYYRSYTNGVWKSIVSLTSGSGFTDELPRAVVTRDSTLWVFFERDTTTGPYRQIYYKTLSGNKWSADTILTTDSATNQMPAAMVIKNGNIWVAWSRNTTVGGNTTIYYRSFNGTRWSGDTPLTTPGVTSSPSLVQDRNGTIWLFWSQTLNLNTTITQDQILYTSSTNVGQTWAPAANLTDWGDVNNPINNETPFAVQGIDTTLYVFFATDVVEPYGFGFHIYYIQSSPIYPVHSLAISNIQVSSVKMYPYGDNPVSLTTITVTVSNLGDFTESNVLLTVQAVNKTTTTIFTKSMTLLASIPTMVSFVWNVTGFSPARYTVSASIPPLPTESIGNSLGHSLTYKSVAVYYAGDVKRDGKVDIFDLSICAYAWQTTPSSPKYNGDCDVKRHYIIDIFDMSVMASNWQKSI
jgi:hypothetical protein